MKFRLLKTFYLILAYAQVHVDLFI